MQQNKQASGLVPPSSPLGAACWIPSLLGISSASLVVLLAYFLSPASKAEAPSYGSLPGFSDLSNGTHIFQRTVVLVSLDGLRSDYLLRGLTPHLGNISKQGIRAEYLKPVFPMTDQYI
ncbi:hypothetical protein HD554DRAFT_2083167 [Boletus coccyginus]|nr:hypothetical protein HD554DRAFT_2083167 [Boletus coccyginus]